MAENIMNSDHKASNPKSRAGWDRTFHLDQNRYCKDRQCPHWSDILTRCCDKNPHVLCVIMNDLALESQKSGDLPLLMQEKKKDLNDLCDIFYHCPDLKKRHPHDRMDDFIVGGEQYTHKIEESGDLAEQCSDCERGRCDGCDIRGWDSCKEVE